jgi:hypothetical protein
MVNVDKKVYMSSMKKYFELMVNGMDGQFIKRMISYVKDHE